MNLALPIAHACVRPSFRIGDLARKVGKSPRAVRLYEEMGLLGAPVRTEGGHRIYGEDALVRLTWIEKLQVLGLSLPDIRTFVQDLASAEHGPAAMHKVRGMFEAKLNEVRGQIEALHSLATEIEAGRLTGGERGAGPQTWQGPRAPCPWQHPAP